MGAPSVGRAAGLGAGVAKLQPRICDVHHSFLTMSYVVNIKVIRVGWVFYGVAN